MLSQAAKGVVAMAVAAAANAVVFKKSRLSIFVVLSFCRKNTKISNIDTCKDVTHGQKAAIIERDNRYTCNVLHHLGFHWSSTSWDYVDQMLKAIAGFGYFDL
jgi:hypothetical protein